MARLITTSSTKCEKVLRSAQDFFWPRFRPAPRIGAARAFRRRRGGGGRSDDAGRDGAMSPAALWAILVLPANALVTIPGVIFWLKTPRTIIPSPYRSRLRNFSTVQQKRPAKCAHVTGPTSGPCSDGRRTGGVHEGDQG